MAGASQPGSSRALTGNPSRPRLLRAWLRFRIWARRIRLSRKLAYGLVVMAVISGTATVATMTGQTGSGPATNSSTILGLLALDGLLLLLLGAVIARRLALVWAERRRGIAGSGLLVRLVVLFSAVAVTPAILVAVFSALFLNFGVQGWFSDRVRTAIDESRAVAALYLNEHRQSIRNDTYAMAIDLNRVAHEVVANPARFNEALSTQAALRSLPEALVVNSTGKILAKSRFSMLLQFDLVPQGALEKARLGEIIVLSQDLGDRVRAVVRLNSFADAYLIVGRFVDKRVLDHMARTEGAARQFQELEAKKEGILITFVLIFVVVALLLLLAAVWIGIGQATHLAQPISDLIKAAEEVSAGDLSVRVSETGAGLAEIGTLNRAFNRMTKQLQSQRHGLIDANRQLDERRRFTETVLAGVSAGVIGLDAQLRINLPNRRASELLATDLDSHPDTLLADMVPEMAKILREVSAHPRRIVRQEISLSREGRAHILLVSTTAEFLEKQVIGYVVTFDDVTDLVSAQRQAAWADVARRIAHEIKNPLTPIQLAAERLNRKYLSEIKTDPEIFATCTETIVRQVGAIEHLVEEFSSFARMPEPVLKEENLSRICEEAVFLERNRYPGIAFETDVGHGVTLQCDARQISQALTNLLKNAAESVAGDDGVAVGKARSGGTIKLSVETATIGDRKRLEVVIEDDGPGFPSEQRNRLTEPYVTRRATGTGLGLAIVRRIMEDHGGELILEDRKSGGARVRLIFAAIDPPQSARNNGSETAEEAQSGPATASVG